MISEKFGHSTLKNESSLNNTKLKKNCRYRRLNVSIKITEFLVRSVTQNHSILVQRAKWLQSIDSSSYIQEVITIN
jgi:hypothetical protein